MNADIWALIAWAVASPWLWLGIAGLTIWGQEVRIQGWRDRYQALEDEVYGVDDYIKVIGGK